MLDVETLGAALKLAKKGGGGGGEGGSGAVIDDSKISSSTTWSSQKIVDTLCPPFTVSGATVQCTPVANYPLDVQVAITPTQEGTGDPSPENVRPIVGWDSVNVWRGGKNLLDWSKVSAFAFQACGMSFEKKENSIRVFGTSTQNGGSSFNIASTTQSEIRGKNFIFSWFTKELSVISVYGLRNVSENNIAIQMNLQEGQVYDFTIQIALGVQKLTAYEPYQGNTYTVQLGQTVYGGDVDVGTGEGSENWRYRELNGTESISLGNVDKSDAMQQFNVVIIDPQTDAKLPCMCNILPQTIDAISGNALGIYHYSQSIFVFGFPRAPLREYGFIDGNTETYMTAFKAYLAAQFAAGTPVTIAYKLATPTTFQATGGQSLPALPGTNTIYTDAGVVTVSGLSDTVETFNALENRIAALEEAAISE